MHGKIAAPILAALLLLPTQAALAQDTATVPDETVDIRVLLAAKLETTLSSQMTGTFTKLNAELGQHVSKGDVLARFDCREGEARANVARAELNMAQLSLEAKRNMQKLNAAGELEVAVAATEVQKAEGARVLAETQNSYCQVTAPFDGNLAKIYVKAYQTVEAGTPLVDLVSDDALKVRLNAPSNFLPKLKIGTPLEIRIHETGGRYTAHISAINPRVDAVAQSVELEADLDAKHPELVAGMSGTASFPTIHEP